MTGWFFANMVWASALMIGVLIVRRPFARLFGAGPTYALWLIPALRLVLPPLPAGSVGITDIIPSPPVILWAEDAAAPLPPAGGPGQWVPILLAIWALGAAALFVWQWLAYRGFLTRLSLSARSLGAYRGLPLLESGAVSGPLALGLLDRRIVVPLDFATRYTEAERNLALEHEAVHHRRGDLWWNHAALLVLALNWFNPVAWIAFRAFRADQELACDAVVTATASPQARCDYAQALIKSASRPGLIAACPLNHADQLKRRLKMMKDHRRSRRRMLGGATALVLLAGIGAATGAPGLAQQSGQGTQSTPAPEARTERREERRVVIHTDRIDHQGEGARGSDDERPARRNQMLIVTDGAGGEAADRERIRIHADRLELSGDCANGTRNQVEEGDGDRRTRIIVCGNGESTAAEQAERLQRARDRLAGDGELTGEHRERMLAAIDREIARLRAQ